MLTDHERTRRIKRHQQAIDTMPEWARESDWAPLLWGLAISVGGIFFTVGCIHLYLRIFGG